MFNTQLNQNQMEELLREVETTSLRGQLALCFWLKIQLGKALRGAIKYKHETEMANNWEVLSDISWLLEEKIEMLYY